eukprot:4059574-Prymnesium_polylepis.1
MPPTVVAHRQRFVQPPALSPRFRARARRLPVPSPFARGGNAAAAAAPIFGQGARRCPSDFG